jgi:hypothetical protein
MARKTTGNGISKRSKKNGVSTSPAPVQVSPEVRESGRPANQVHVERPGNLEEEIRRRAYELYQQRGGNGNGDENQDWLIAEREIRSRFGSQEQHTA